MAEGTETGNTFAGPAQNTSLALPVVLPILGYASWHLYRRAVASASP